MTNSAGDLACTKCGGDVEFDLSAQTEICTSCGAVSQTAASSSLIGAPVTNEPTVFKMEAKKMRAKQIFMKTAVAAGNYLAFPAGPLQQYFPSLASSLLWSLPSIPRGCALRNMALAALLLHSRLEPDVPTLTLNDVSRAGNAEPSSVSKQYSILIAHPLFANRAPAPPRPIDFLPRFKETTESLCESWPAARDLAANLLAKGQALWLESGQRPVIIAAAILVLAVRACAARACSALPALGNCFKKFAMAAGAASARVVQRAYLAIVNAFLELFEVSQRPSCKKVHCEIDRVLIALERSGKEVEIVPKALKRTREEFEKRKEILGKVRKRVREGIEVRSEGTEREIEVLVKAGAKDQEVCAGNLMALRTRIEERLHGNAEETLSKDCDAKDIEYDVSESIKTPSEILSHATAMAAMDA